jgi:hypothetical protein
MSVCISAPPTGRVLVKFNNGRGEAAMKICRENPNLFKIGQKFPALYMKTQVRFIVSGDIKSSQKRHLGVKR